MPRLKSHPAPKDVSRIQSLDLICRSGAGWDSSHGPVFVNDINGARLVWCFLGCICSTWRISWLIGLLPVGRKQIDLVLAAAVDAPADNSQNSYRVVPVMSMADRELLVLQHVGFPHLQELMEVLDLASCMPAFKYSARFFWFSATILSSWHCSTIVSFCWCTTSAMSFAVATSYEGCFGCLLCVVPDSFHWFLQWSFVLRTSQPVPRNCFLVARSWGLWSLTYARIVIHSSGEAAQCGVWSCRTSSPPTNWHFLVSNWVAHCSTFGRTHHRPEQGTSCRFLSLCWRSCTFWLFLLNLIGRVFIRLLNGIRGFNLLGANLSRLVDTCFPFTCISVLWWFLTFRIIVPDWAAAAIFTVRGHSFGHTRWTPEKGVVTEKEKQSLEWGRNKWQEKQSPEWGRNKWQHPKRMNLLSICRLTMHVTCNAVSLDQLEPKKAHEITSEKTGSCFCLNTKTHYGP